MIEVVRNAITVHQIQKRAGRIAALQLDSSQLYKWIKGNNMPTGTFTSLHFTSLHSHCRDITE